MDLNRIIGCLLCASVCGCYSPFIPTPKYTCGDQRSEENYRRGKGRTLTDSVWSSESGEHQQRVVATRITATHTRTQKTQPSSVLILRSSASTERILLYDGWFDSF